MKFKPGDIAIYIKHGDEWYESAKLIIGHKYTVKSSYMSRGYYEVITIENDYAYNTDRFVTLEEFRGIKLEKIKSKIKKYGSN